MTQRNTPERADMLAKRAAEQLSRRPRFTPIAGTPSFSTRGQRGAPWNTKRWTDARWLAREEAHEHRREIARRLKQGMSA